ncbi:MAG TPA: fibronectin type III-like domain-contianing protein [Mobilitalea sp.]|nr:fibronectin type III-like domain-contianing protein [Mobilitalea sp.]
MLYGDTNPSGKLAMSFPYTIGQVPVFYNEFHTGRPNQGEGKFFSKYLDVPNEPLYPFGYGLSYTQFSISEVELSGAELSRNIVIKASVTVKNIGTMTGKEVIQLYFQDICGSVVRPVRELRGFQKIELAPGEERRISFTISEEMLRFYGIDMKYASEPGEFHVYIGNCSTTQNRKRFILQ